MKARNAPSQVRASDLLWTLRSMLIRRCSSSIWQKMVSVQFCLLQQTHLRRSPLAKWPKKGVIHQMNYWSRIKDHWQQSCLIMLDKLKPPGASLAPTMESTTLSHYLPIFKPPRKASPNSLRASTITLNCLLIPIMATLKTGIRMTSSRNIASSNRLLLMKFYLRSLRIPTISKR